MKDPGGMRKSPVCICAAVLSAYGGTKNVGDSCPWHAEEGAVPVCVRKLLHKSVSHNVA